MTNNCRLSLLFLSFAALCTPQVLAASETPNYSQLDVTSNHAAVVDQSSGAELYSKNADEQRPIASISKLMTATVVLDAKLSLDQKVLVSQSDIDTVRRSHSRLKVGIKHTRRELLQLALMSSENRAASALARSYPGGMVAFVKAMNNKAKQLGMTHTHFEDPTGLHSENVSTARDLVKLVQAGFQYDLIRQFTTSTSYNLKQGRVVKYKNSNPLFKDENWEIGLSKTGYIKPAGHCLVMQAMVAERPVIIVLLDAAQRAIVSEDSDRIKGWVAELTHKNDNFISKVGFTEPPSDKPLTAHVDNSVEDQVIDARVKSSFEPPSASAFTVTPH